VIHPLTDHVSLTIWGWTILLMLAFVAGLTTGLCLRRPQRAPEPSRTTDERDTLDGTETVAEIARRCL